MRNVVAVVGLFLLTVFLVGASVQNGELVGTAKIDSLLCDGLNGIKNSLCYRVHEIEKHNHSNARWLALHGTPSGEVTIADSMANESTPFQSDAGNDTFGAWVQVLGSGDTPREGTNAYFDLHKIEVVDREHNTTTYLIQVGCDASGADAITNGNYTEVVYFSGGATAAGGSILFWSKRYAAGTKCWVRHWAYGQNTSTLDFYMGLHEYAG